MHRTRCDSTSKSTVKKIWMAYHDGLSSLGLWTGQGETQNIQIRQIAAFSIELSHE